MKKEGDSYTMKHNKWLFRLTAISLSTALFLTSISFPAIAAETSDSSTDSIEVETTALNETNLYAEDTTAATQKPKMTRFLRHSRSTR